MVSLNLPRGGSTKMDFDDFFKTRVDALHAEGRYRVFADLERRCGRFPRAFDHRIGGEVTVWCSNDYLGMGQHPAVLAAMAEELRGSGAGAGVTCPIFCNWGDCCCLETDNSSA